MPECDLSRAIGPPITIVARTVDPSLTDAELHLIERTYRSSYDTHCWRGTEAFPSVADTLGVLRDRGCELFIVTNKPLLPTSKILAHLGWSGLFTEVVTRDIRTPAYSTKAEMVSCVLNRNRLDPVCTILIGDTHEDQVAAQANGIGFLHVSYGYGLLTSPPLHTVHHFSEIVRLLEIKKTKGIGAE